MMEMSASTLLHTCYSSGSSSIPTRIATAKATVPMMKITENV